MIPQAFITAWSQRVPWQNPEQVEQDLIISRVLVEIFSDEWLAQNLAFRGGTALHKLYLNPPLRYSEDIDLVQTQAGPIKDLVQRLQQKLSFMGSSGIEKRQDAFRVLCRYSSEFPPSIRMRLKVEVNTREHFSVLGYTRRPYEVSSPWFSGSATIISYRIEELLATKLRALYQRRKGRDLFDLYLALTQYPNIDTSALLTCYREYMLYSSVSLPTVREFIENLKAKLRQREFLGDTTALIRPGFAYDPFYAYQTVLSTLIGKM